MIRLDGFWDFISYRPGLSATADEWRGCLGDDGWRVLRKQLFIGDGIAHTCTRSDGRTFRVVPLSKGTYGLVCPVTGNLEQADLAEADVKAYRLNVTVLRSLVSEALGFTPDPQSVREVPRAFPVGNWVPVTGADIPAYMILSPTARLLASEIGQLLVECGKGFILLVPKQPELPGSLRAQIERQQAAIIPLVEVVVCDTTGRFSASPCWETYQNAYCQRHLPDRMVPAQPEYQFAKRGMWALRFAGKETYLEGDLKGAAFIHYLIRHQGQEIHVIRMMADVAGAERVQITPEAEGLALAASDAGDVVDEKTIRDCRERYEQLEIKQEEARRAGDRLRLGEIKEEIGQIAAYLSTSLGLGGRSRKALDDVSKVRRRIARVINITIGKIEQSDPDLATHLRNSVKAHINMSYAPDRPIDWVLE